MVRNARSPSHLNLPRLKVVVPAHQAADMLPRCLDALIEAGFEPHEILVVDDGSTDGTAEGARTRGIEVVRNERSLGASGARNRGVADVVADIVVFVDADVLVHPDTKRRIAQAFETPDLDAVFGSYDCQPSAPGLVARYRNLLHHFVHQRGRPHAQTFWTGLGAVRRATFLELGGFDKAWENIEDSEFGVRLTRAGGRIRLDHDLLGTHLKAWTLASMFKTDLWGRAIPWTRLILFEGGPKNDLNMTAEHRASAISVAVFGASLLLVIHDPLWLALTAVAVASFIWANFAFLCFLSERKGLAFAAAALPVHAVHYLAGGLGFAWVLLSEGIRRLRPGSGA